MVNHLCVWFILSLWTENLKWATCSFVRSSLDSGGGAIYPCFDSGNSNSVITISSSSSSYTITSRPRILSCTPYTVDASREADGKSAADSAADAHTYTNRRCCWCSSMENCIKKNVKSRIFFSVFQMHENRRYFWSGVSHTERTAL